jgi:hypothetical protein
MMKLSNANFARVVRDAGIDAMDALSAILTDAATYAPSADEEGDIRLAIARSISAILDNIVNPVLRNYPEFEVGEDSWGTIAADRARERLTSKT